MLHQTSQSFELAFLGVCIWVCRYGGRGEEGGKVWTVEGPPLWLLSPRTMGFIVRARLLSAYAVRQRAKHLYVQEAPKGAAAANFVLSLAYSSTSLMQWASSTTNRATLTPFSVFTKRSLLNRSGET